MIRDILSLWLLKLLTRIKLWRSGLKEKSVEMKLDNSDRVIHAHYLEREAKCDDDTKNNILRRDLLIIPGFTASADSIMLDLVLRLNPIPSGWRIIIMDLPFHNNNIVNFNGKYPDWEGIYQYTLAFTKAVGMTGGEKIPLNLVGYSLGGNVCMRYLHRYPDLINSIVLVAPAFPETLDDDFTKLMEKNPRLAHGWETLDEAREFCTNTGLGCHRGHVLTYNFVLRGLVRQRREIYGKLHDNFFANYWSTINNNNNKNEVENTNNNNPLDLTLLRQIRTPILCVTGERDNCVSSKKCQTYISDRIDEKYLTFHELPDTGHYGGPKKGRIDENIFDGVAPMCSEFLFV